MADAAMEAALTRFEKENHPTIMQTSADILIKLLTNILRNPSEPKYRSINTVNKNIADKLLVAKAARQLLLVVGFIVAEEGTTKMVMPEDPLRPGKVARIVKIVRDRLQDLLADKAERDRVAREEAIAKNKVQASKMRVKQEEIKRKKQQMATAMKMQQQQDREERVAKSDPIAKDATQDLQNLYATGGLSRSAALAGKQEITVVLFTPDGQDRITLPATATFGQLKKKIAAELGIPEEKQILGLDRGCKEVVTSESVTLSAKKIGDRSFVGLRYPGFARPEKKGFQSSTPLAEKHVKVRAGANSLRAQMAKSGKMGITLSEFERLEAERLLAPKKLEETPVKFVAIDHDTSSAFISYCRETLATSTKRCGLLYGNFVEKDGEMGVNIDAIYEPAQDCTPEDINITELSADADEVDRLAARLGLTRVGWIFFRPERDYMFSCNELLVMASLQGVAQEKSRAELQALEAKIEKAWGPEKPELQKGLPVAQKKAEEGKHFVTLQAFPSQDPATGTTNIEVLAFQASQQACSWAAAGHFHQSRTKPTLAKATSPMKFEVEKKEAYKCPVDYFFGRCHQLNFQHTSFLASAFTAANRIDAPQDEAATGSYFRGRSSRPFLEVWSDFNLLVYLVQQRTFGVLSGGNGSGSALGAMGSDMDRLVNAVSEQKVLSKPDDDRFRQMVAPTTGSVSGRGAHGGASAGSSAIFGSGAAAQWASEAATLQAMGFDDREAVLAVLAATGGNVEQAISILAS